MMQIYEKQKKSKKKQRARRRKQHKRSLSKPGRGQQQTKPESIYLGSRESEQHLRICVWKILNELFFHLPSSWILNFVATKSASQFARGFFFRDWIIEVEDFSLLALNPARKKAVKDVKDFASEFVCFLRRVNITRWARLVARAHLQLRLVELCSFGSRLIKSEFCDA